ncbi:transforming acidic coiled-coil-containing protein 3 isoform X1 [Manis pentadactyla]|uniref:transforming acidic coiled-coil-containing protein 3 isoform X1 n=1 Tax=Manis pentadactyla TaxID=143292 RepID=UPI00255C7B5F|nr:transforming acidic coiled-coil-containing protein 3 isoform X1 [Manis pentadactyla]XP_036777308.2 transforming acidic coiled-coil-containing protein 3 isoform X1 [Manis pentadactyla]
MSLQIFNDKNVTGDKSTENCDFLFLPPELTGRSTVLRLSQKENVPPKSTAKAMKASVLCLGKVTFQTPLRDPQTHRILSPSMSSQFELCFALDDTIGLENSHQIWTQKENQQFAKEVDTKTTNGIQQKPAVADANPPPGHLRPASEDRCSSRPTSAPLTSLGPSGSSQMLESPQHRAASPGQMSGSLGRSSEEGAHSSSSEWSVTSASDVLEDPPGTAPQDRPEDTPRAAGGGWGCISASSPTLPHGAHPQGARGEGPLAGLPGEAPARPEDASGPENTAPASPQEAEGAMSPRPQAEGASGRRADPSPGRPARLEFDFSDQASSERSPPPGTLGKRPGLKAPLRGPEAGQKEALTEASKGPILPPWGSHILDWDKLDDPSFDLSRGGGEAWPSQQPKSRSARPVAKQLSIGPMAAEDLPLSQQVPEASVDSMPLVTTSSGTTEATGEEGTTDSSGALAPSNSPGSEPSALPATPACPAPQRGPEPTMDPEEEHFRDPAEVLGVGAEVDYLEQFGTSSFKESALRKQSLYLKFDPLLKDSPQRPAAAAPKSSSMQVADAPSLEGPEVKLVELDSPGAAGVPVLCPPLCVLGPLQPPLGPIVDVLQYSQRDLDAAVEAVQKENLLLQSQCEALHAKNLEMGKIMDGFEGIVYQAMEEAQKQKELSKAEIQKVLKEKDQLATDLSSMEKSFSDLFKRFEKQKEAIEGYRANEESLKKCVQDYIVRIEKEGQRYQALKAHAEEKLRLANEEIAQVRSKAQAEALAFQASLRKEQTRIHSLETAVEQKTKENDELTRICDDLISKMEKI